ncbi:MAG: lipid-A-disaccharide synthase, partial [Alphaproteobacteria bacterium]|nr:lipid-A-disaccharide synthase [Alphaproteobacteria bacterium]
MEKKVFIIAGEASGDMWGAPIVKGLLKKNVTLKGLGGTEMKVAGLKSNQSITPLSIMGLFEVLKNLPSVLRVYKKTMVQIKNFKPDVLFTIDSPGFNFRIAKAVKKWNPDVKCIHFVAPQVWAWKPERAAKVAKLFDHLLCLFPFEPKYFTPHGLKTTLVGHPVIESGVENGDAKRFKEKFKIKKGSFVLPLIPGSRKSEIERTLPVLLKAAKILSYAFPQTRFFIPTVEATHTFVRDFVKNTDMNLNIKLIKGSAINRFDLFAASNVALAASGSVSLELGLANVPHCVCYKFNPLTYWIGKRLVQTKFANLFNIASNRERIPEFIQEKCTPEKLAHFAFSILSNKEEHKRMQLRLKNGVKNLLETKE